MSLFTSAARDGDLRALQDVPRRLAAINSSASVNATLSTNSSSGSGSGSGSMADVVVGSSASTSSSSLSDEDDALVSNYGDESASASSDADLMYRRTQGSCAYYPVSASGCRAPRSCFDCLNYAVAPERAGCMVSERGQCVSVTGNYTASRDFHYATAANSNATATNSSSYSGSSDVDVSVSLVAGAGVGFAAANATYCAWSDAKCAACRRSVFLEYSAASITSTSLFCTGQDGCVCVALCELDDWAARVGAGRCTNTTTTAQAGSSTSSSAGAMTPVNSGAGGGGETTDESTRGGVGGQDDSDVDTSGGLGTFWNAACGVLAALAVTLAVVMYMSKRHRQSRRQRHLRTPQAPTLSPRGGQRPPESLIASLFHWSNRNDHARQAGSTTTETTANPTDAESTEDETTSDDNRSLRLFGWQAMRQQVIEKETLRPVVVSSGIRRVAISRCLPSEAIGNGAAVSSECLSSPRSLPALGHIEEEEVEHAILSEGGGNSRRFTIMSLSSGAMLSPPSYVIPFMDEHDEEEDDCESGNTTGDCFDELVTPPARSRMLL